MNLEVANLSVEGHGHLCCRKGHLELREESRSSNLQVVTHTDGCDDGSRPGKYQCACTDLLLYQVEVYPCVSFDDDTKTVVINSEGRFLSDHQLKNPRITMNDTQLVADKDMFPYLREVGLKDIPHAREVH